MSNYVLKEKSKNKLFGKWPVDLVEHMIFIDKEKNEKCVLLKVQNQTYRKINAINIELTQYNEHGDFIAKAKYIFDELAIVKYGFVVLNKRIEVKNECVYLDYKLTYAQSNVDFWENKIWKKNTLDQGSIDEVFETKETVKNTITTISPKKIRFPYGISLTLYVIFIIAVVAVFNAINT